MLRPPSSQLLHFKNLYNPITWIHIVAQFSCGQELSQTPCFLFSSPKFNQGKTKSLKEIWSSCGVPDHCRRVEQDGPHQSIPTQRILWFYEGVLRGWCVCLWDACWPCVVATVQGRVTADPTHHLVCDFTLQGQEKPLTGISPHALLCGLGPAALHWKPAVPMVGLLPSLLPSETTSSCQII